MPRRRPWEIRDRIPAPAEAKAAAEALGRGSVSHRHRESQILGAERFVEWCRHHRVPTDPVHAAAFIAALHEAGAPAEALRKTGTAVKKFLDAPEFPPLEVITAAVTKLNSSGKKMKAMPIPPTLYVSVLHHLAEPTRTAAAWVAIVTSSRWDDMLQVTRACFTTTQRRAVVDSAKAMALPWTLDWTRTKSNPYGADRADHTQALPKIPRVLAEWLASAPPDAPITKLSTDEVRRRLRAVPVPQALHEEEERLAGHPLRSRLTAHSLKRTGVNLGVVAAAQLEQQSAGRGPSELEKVQSRAKHRQLDLTRGYTTRPAHWAIAMGSRADLVPDAAADWEDWSQLLAAADRVPPSPPPALRSIVPSDSESEEEE